MTKKVKELSIFKVFNKYIFEILFFVFSLSFISGLVFLYLETFFLNNSNLGLNVIYKIFIFFGIGIILSSLIIFYKTKSDFNRIESESQLLNKSIKEWTLTLQQSLEKLPLKEESQNFANYIQIAHETNKTLEKIKSSLLDSFISLPNDKSLQGINDLIYSNEKIFDQNRQSLEEITFHFRESLQNISDKIEQCQLRQLKNIEKGALISSDYSFEIPTEDYEIIKVSFLEISDLNKKMEKEQVEIEKLKNETHKLANETQNVLSILRNKVGVN